MSHNKTKYYPVKLGLFVGTIAFLVLTALTSFWLQNNIFDNKNFTDITTQAMSKESSRRSIGELVSNRIFERTPILRSILSERLAEHISGVLVTERAQGAVNRVVRDSQLLVTSPQRNPLSIDLTGLKGSISAVQNITDRTDDKARFDVNSIPDEVVLIDTSGLPNFHRQALWVVWLGPLSVFLVICLTAWWVLRASGRFRVRRLCITLLAVTLGALSALALGPLVEPSFIALGRDAPTQSLMRNVYEAFMTPFNHQAVVVGTSAVVVAGILATWHWVVRRYTIVFSLKKRNI